MSRSGWWAAAVLAGWAVWAVAGESGEPRRGAESPTGQAETIELDGRALERIRNPPLGLPAVPVPAENPPSAAKIQLGRKLFVDRRLSANGTLSCAMCHIPEQGFTSHELQTAVGFEGRSLPRNAPTLLNAVYAVPYFHDGREPILDLQPIDVFLDPREMAAPSAGSLVAKVRSLPGYPEGFEQAFGELPTLEGLGQALGSYVRSLVSANSPFDRWYFGGEDQALGEAARRGFELFTGKGRCVRCHLIGEDEALFTDHRFHDTGIGWRSAKAGARGREPVRVELAPGVFTDMDRSQVESVGRPPAKDLGRYEFTGRAEHRYQFKTPILRNVSLTAPYMHDGSLPTLQAVVEFYDRGGAPHEGLDPLIRPLGLTGREIEDLVAFLESLTGDNVAELVRDARSVPVANPGGPR